MCYVSKCRVRGRSHALRVSQATCFHRPLHILGRPFVPPCPVSIHLFIIIIIIIIQSLLPADILNHGVYLGKLVGRCPGHLRGAKAPPCPVGRAPEIDTE